MDKEKQEELIEEKVEDSAGKAPSEQTNGINNVFATIIQNGMMLMQAIGLPPTFMEMIYGYGSELYDAGKYYDAASLFFFLAQLNPKEPRFFFSCAASFHKMKKYTEASSYYLMAANVDPENPLPFFHAADCSLQTEEPEFAILLLDKTIAIAGESSQHEKIKQQALALRDVVQKKLDKQEVKTK